MPVLNQRFIDLLNVPKSQLLGAVEALAERGDLKVKNPRSMSAWDLASQLENVRRSELEELTGGYLYAGRTSIVFYRLDQPRDPADDDTPSDPLDPTLLAEDPPQVLSGQELDLGEVDTALRSLSEGVDPFDENSRPSDIGREPKLVVAQRLDDGSRRLTFVVKKRASPVIHDYVVEDVEADEFFVVLIDPAAGLVEVRARQQTAAALDRHWLRKLANELSLESFPVSITDSDLTALKAELNAKLKRFRGKTANGGVVDTVEVAASPADDDDLEGDADFVSYSSGLERMLGDLTFTHLSKKLTVRVSRQGSELGSIYFRTAAPEATIEYVREALRRVKTRHLRS